MTDPPAAHATGVAASAVLSIHSRVSPGTVGNSLIEAAFRLRAPAVSLHTIDTVQWTGPGNHPRLAGLVASGHDLGAMLAVLLDSPQSGGAGLGHVVAGYLRTADQVAAVAAMLHRHPPVALLLDPILGDAGRLYVDVETARTLRLLLLPLAHYMVPNLTEACWLATGHPSADMGEPGALERIAAALFAGAPALRGLAITGLPHPDPTRIGVAVWDDPATPPNHIYHPRCERDSHGTGDLFTGLVAAQLFGGTATFAQAAARAAEATGRALQRVAGGQSPTLLHAINAPPGA